MAFELRSVFEDLSSSFLAEQRQSSCSAQKDSRDTPGRWRLPNILDLLEIIIPASSSSKDSTAPNYDAV